MLLVARSQCCCRIERYGFEIRCYKQEGNSGVRCGPWSLEKWCAPALYSLGRKKVCWWIEQVLSTLVLRPRHHHHPRIDFGDHLFKVLV